MTSAKSVAYEETLEYCQKRGFKKVQVIDEIRDAANAHGCPGRTVEIFGTYEFGPNSVSPVYSVLGA